MAKQTSRWTVEQWAAPEGHLHRGRTLSIARHTPLQAALLCITFLVFFSKILHVFCLFSAKINWPKFPYVTFLGCPKNAFNRAATCVYFAHRFQMFVHCRTHKAKFIKFIHGNRSKSYWTYINVDKVDMTLSINMELLKYEQSLHVSHSLTFCFCMV